MSKGNHINIKPQFKSDEDRLPCDGKAGDLFVFTHLNKDDEIDPEPQGSASLWFCIKGAIMEQNDILQPATWARVQFDGIAMCRMPLPLPPQNRPQLFEG